MTFLNRYQSITTVMVLGVQIICLCKFGEWLNFSRLYVNVYYIVPMSHEAQLRHI